MTRLRKSLNGLRAIPADRMRVKLQKTGIGIFLAATSILGTARWGAPWYVAAGGCLLAATMWSGELVLSPIRMLGAIVVDLVSKTKGKSE